MRTLTLWCPDWPLVGVDPDQCSPAAPVAVFVADQVLACSATARAEGIRRGLRRRESQRRCPELVIADRDEGAEVRAFEPVLAALENICPQLEIVRPGLCLFGAKGPGRYFGGDTKLADAVADAVTSLPGLDGTGNVLTPGARIGIADGPFAAGLAARNSPATRSPTIVASGRTAAFLAPFPVRTLDRPELTDLFLRLGLRTLGDLAALPARQLTSRFGTEGSLIHRLARGADDPPLRPRPDSPQFHVQEELDPPEEQIEPLAFVAKMLADRLQAELTRRGLGCTQLLVEAESEYGEARSRLWRQDGMLTATAIAQRVRWQLEGWLTGPADHRPSGGITLLRLTPSGVHHEDGEQLRLFGGPTDIDERALAAVTRLQGLLGFDAVYAAIPAGGRSPAAGVLLTPWGEQIPAAVASPWPGQLPAPNPTVIYPQPVPVSLLDAAGAPISVSERGAVSSAPQLLSNGNGHTVPIINWAGPWQVNERWWDPAAHVSCVRFQVTDARGSARLLALRDTRWSIEGAYE
jgi:protein ImuB